MQSLQCEYNDPLKPGFAASFFFYAELYLVASTIVYSWSRTCQNAPVLLLIYSLLSSISIRHMIHKPGERMLVSPYFNHNHAANISYID